MNSEMRDRVREALPSPVLAAYMSVRSAYRQATSSRRCLPGFLIIGAQKCGTTSLYSYLLQHPEVGKTWGKEIHYFDINYAKGLNWYRSFFPVESGSQKLLCGESSPYYIYHPLACRRVWEFDPSLKLIALLRNPVDRAFSHYKHNVRHHHEALSFEEALARETERIAGEREKIIRSPEYNSESLRNFSYRDRGIYVDQLRQWLDLFPRENLLIIRSEDLFRDAAQTYDDTLEFLGLTKFDPARFGVRNRNPSPSKLDATIRKELEEFYRPHNRRLYDLLGRDFEWESE